MLKFLGNIEAKADSKGRLFVPALYRKSLEKSGEASLILRADPINKCVKLYPESIWAKMDEEFTAHLNLWDQKDLALYRQFTASVEPIDLDSNGRVLISKRHLDMIGVETDALFVGVGNYFEIWNKQTFEGSLSAMDDFAAAMQSKMGNSKQVL
ncbi:MAG: division/cell wall cluster transcriptional repressor MraZ [Paludibacteraceae bacterium]|nr:division/cell wall cluster transcriptional repressor MraZ [Paludibacteraceae bacterium]